MKIKYLMVAIAMIVIGLSACTKKSGIILQAHDSNRMMDSMHAMMDKMDMAKMTDDPEIDFATMMAMHHQGAISMSNLELSAGTNDSLKRTAQKIINEQQLEIQQLKTILSAITVDNTDTVFTAEHKAGMEKMGKTADVQIITGDIDNDFATLMMVHHQSAIDNASSYLHHGNNAQLKTIANKIISSQTMEIDELANWLKASRR